MLSEKGENYVNINLEEKVTVFHIFFSFFLFLYIRATEKTAFERLAPDSSNIK